MTRLLMLILFAFSFPLQPQERCFPEPRLIPGEQGEVLFTNGSPLNVRGGAGRSFSVTGIIPEGSLFEIIEGPICADDINWFRIESPSGWIAESTQDEGYFVAPVYAGRDKMKTLFENAPLFDLAQADEDVKILDFGSYTITNREGELLLSLPSIGTLSSDGVTIYEEDELQFWTYEGELFTFPTPSQPDDMELISVRAAPDGSQAAWLFSNCENIFGCPSDTGYVLLLQDQTETRELWNGEPEIGRYSISHWREDGQSISLLLTDEAAYPEPGTASGTDIGYAPEGRLLEIDVQSGEIIEKQQFRAVSSTGKWRVFGLYPSITVEGDETYTVEESSSSFHNLQFSPDETLLVWTQVNNNSNYQRDSIDLKVMKLDTGTVDTIFTFADHYPSILSWLSDRLIRVQVKRIEYTHDSSVVSTLEHDLIFDVSSGEFWRFDMPDRWIEKP